MPRVVGTRSVRRGKTRPYAHGARLLAAEAAYADSMLKLALGDGRGCIKALEAVALVSFPVDRPM